MKFQTIIESYMQVMKFGGTSVANAENMSKVVDIVSKAVERDRTILVSSAISGCTDTLIKIGIRARNSQTVSMHIHTITSVLLQTATTSDAGVEVSRQLWAPSSPTA